MPKHIVSIPKYLVVSVALIVMSFYKENKVIWSLGIGVKILPQK